MPVMSVISGLFILGNEVVGVFVPGATVNMYGQMKLDINQTRGIVEQVIPPKTIENTTRFNTVMNEFEHVMNAVDDYNAVFVKDGKEIIKLYIKHDSKQGDFQKVFSEMDAAREAEVKKILESRSKMKGVMTPEEWQALFSPQDKTKG
jgi:hypothetical protein